MIPLNVLLPLIGYAAAFAAGFGLEYVMTDRTQAKKEVIQQAAEVAQVKATTVVTDKAEAKQVEAQTKIVTVYRDRIKEVQVYVAENQEMDGTCVVPNRFVSLWNTGNQALPADAAAVADESDSGVRLSDIESEHDAEAALCNSAIEVARGWQEWYAELPK